MFFDLKNIMEQNSDINIVCISNGNNGLFENTLTNFMNKIPETITWRKNGVYKYHVALSALGFSTNFSTTILPDKLGIPSLIYSRPYRHQVNETAFTTKKFKVYSAKPLHSDCVALNSIPQGCNTTVLDFNIYPYVNKYSSYKYHFLEDELFNLKRYIDFFKNVIATSDGNLTLEIIGTKLIIKNVGLWRADGEKNFYNYKTTHLFFHHTLLESIKVTSHKMRTDPWTYLMSVHWVIENMFDKEVIIGGERYSRYFLHHKFSYLTIDLLDVNKKKIPNIVKLKFNGIRSQIFDDKKSRDLICFHPNLENKHENYLFHEVESKTFYPLENTILDTLEFKLVDENDKPVNLNTGIATLVKLQFRKMPYFKKSFSVRMTSTPSKNHPENVNSNFSLELPETLYFSKNWRVSVNSINLPNYFNTLPPKQVLSLAYTDTDGLTRVRQTVKLPDKVFTKSELINYINAQMAPSTQPKPFLVLEENIQTGDYTPTLCIKVYKNNSALTMSKDLALLFGYGAADFFQIRANAYFTTWSIAFDAGLEEQEIRMSNPINMEYFTPSYVMMYSNIVEPTIIGGNYSNILKIFPVITSQDEYVIHQFKHREFHSLLNNEVKNINLQFRTHSGDYIYFASDNYVIVDLIFSNFE